MVVEDELAIQPPDRPLRLAVDVGDADEAANVFTEDCVYDVDVGRMAGRDAVRKMVRGRAAPVDGGQCAHQIGPALVELRGPSVPSQPGYSRVYLQTARGLTSTA